MTTRAEEHIEGLIVLESPRLGRRHRSSAELIRNIAGLGALVEKAVGEAPSGELVC
jgi:hypothetical protein